MANAPHLIKKILRIAGIVLLSLLTLLLIIALLLQLPSVQNYAAQRATDFLSKRIDSEFSVGSIQLDFFNRLRLENLYVEDQRGDTLAYLGLLEARIGAFNPFDQAITISGIELENGYVQLNRNQDSLFNFQFIADAFASDTPADTTAAPWDIDIDALRLRQVRFGLNDALARSDLYLQVEAFTGTLSEFNLADQIIGIDQINWTESQLTYRAQSDTTLQVDTLSDASPLAFPYTGWDITANRIQLQDIDIQYDNTTQAPMADGRFDPNHLSLGQLAVDLQELRWDSTTLSGDFQQLAFRERNGFWIRNMETGIAMTQTELALSQLSMNSPGSEISSAEFSLRYPSFAELPNFVNTGELSVRIPGSRFAFSDLYYWAGPLPYLRLEAEEALQLSGQLDGPIDRLRLRGLAIKAGRALNARLSGTLSGLPDPEQLSFDLQLHRLRASYAPLMAITEGISLPEGLDTWQWVELSGQARGRIDRFRLRPLVLSTDQTTQLRANALITGLPDTDRLRFEAQVEELNTHVSELAAFSPSELPPEVMRLGSIVYAGQVAGTAYDFKLDGQLDTDQGAFQHELALNFNQDYSNATYQGNGRLQNFRLGQVLGDTATFGPLNLRFEVDGEGLSLDQLNARLYARASRLTLFGNDYGGAFVDGRFQEQAFNGKARIQGESLAAALDGYVNLRDTLPLVNAKLDVDTLDLYALGLYPSPLTVRTTATAEIEGSQMDDFKGVIRLDSTELSNEEKQHTVQQLVLRAAGTDSAERTLSLNGDFVNAELSGDYRIAEIPEIITEFIDGFFPIRQYLDPDAPPSDPAVAPTLASQDFELQFHLSNPQPLGAIFLPALEELDTVALSGAFNSDQKILTLNGLVPSLAYDGLRLDSILLQTDGQPEQLLQTVRVERVSNTEQELLDGSELRVRLYQDSLFLHAGIDEADTSRAKLSLNTLVTGTAEDRFKLHLEPPFILNRRRWSIPQNNEVYFSPTYFNAQNLRFSRGAQLIQIQSQDAPSDQDFAPLRIDFEAFQLRELARLIDYEDNFLSGKLQGGIEIRRPDSIYSYKADLAIDNLLLDSTQAGDLRLLVQPVTDGNAVRVDASLNGAGNELGVRGSYGLASGQLDFRLEAQQIAMALLDFFGQGFIRDSRGRIGADLKLAGTVEKPQLSGSLRMDSTSTVIEYLQTRYLIPQHTIQLQPTTIAFGQMPLIDPKGQQAILSGEVQHEYFEDIRLDLDFDASEFQVLNTSSGDNDLFYGTIFTRLHADVTGSAEQPNVDVTASTLPDTRLTVLPLYTDDAVTREDYIIYSTPAQYRADTSQQQSKQYQVSSSGVDLSLNFELTPDAQLVAVIDPSTGDRLEARGSANLVVDMDRAGNLNTTGVIDVTDGAYYLNYEGLVKRTFNIRKGSTIQLPGNPLDARFDITAVYQTRVAPYDLIQAQAGAESSLATSARKRMDFQVLMQMEGTLDEPNITFDIQLAEGQAGQVADAVEQRLAQIRANQSELNKQVFGLLLFNNFILETGGGVDLATAGENIALKSVSSFLSGQLNKLAEQYVRGVDLNIGLESYNTADGAANSTELQVGLSKAFFDDRLTIQVGSQLGVDSDGNQGEANITGSFLLEYRLDKAGRYRLRVFRRPDFDAFNQSNAVRTGAGLLYKRTFD